MAERDDAPSTVSAADGRSRYRRFHTLAGALGLGSFVALHLLTNASALGGYAAYDTVVGAIERSRLLSLIEVALVLVPLAFHAGYGVHLVRRAGAPDAEIERYGDRRFWLLQRISAVLVLVFVLVHLWELRVQRLLGLPADALYTTLTRHLSWTWAGVPWIALFYLLALVAVSVHLSNGLFAATAVWRIWMTPAGRKRMRVLTITLGLGLFVIGTTTVVGLATGTRLLRPPVGDSGVAQPCGGDLPAAPPFKLPAAPSR